MLYVQYGLKGADMQEINTTNDFEAVLAANPIEIPTSHKTEMVTLNGQEETRAKAIDCCYFIAGKLLNNYRLNENLVNRSLLVLDYDNADQLSADGIKQAVHGVLGAYNYYMYPSTSYTEEQPKFRVIVDPNKVMNEADYRATLKVIEAKIGLPLDDKSYTWSQMQGLPITDDLAQFNSLKVINHGEKFPVFGAEPEQGGSLQSFVANYSSGKKKYTAELFEHIAAGVEDGNRNVWLTSVIGKLLALGTDPNVAYMWLQVINNNFVYPPKSDKEINTIFNSILKKEIRKRGGA